MDRIYPSGSGIIYNQTDENQSYFFSGDYEFAPPLAPEQLLQAVFYLDEYAVPIIFTFGVVLNVLVIVVLLKTELCWVTPCIYFVALSVVDMAYLIQKMIPWASKRLYDIYAVAGVCQLTYYFHYLSTFLEWWLIVSMMSERTFVMFKRKRAKVLCSPFRTKCGIIILSVFSIVSHLYLTWTSAVIKIFNRDQCIIIPENTKDILVLQKIDVFFSFMVPALIVLILLFACMIKICRRRKKASHNVRENSEKQNLRSSIRRPSNFTENHREVVYLKGTNFDSFNENIRLTTVCFVVTLCSLFFCVPYDSLRTKLAIQRQPNYMDQELFQVLNVISSVNFAVKGLIYFIGLQEFRLAAWKLFKRSIQLCSHKYI